MNKSDLVSAEVIGFFSMPSLSLAEHNPSAYNTAMAAMPAGAGTCAYCGTGIRNHVVVRIQSGETVFIGTDCAQKIGGDVGECARKRITSEKRAEITKAQDERRAKWLEERAEIEARKRARVERFADVLAVLVAVPDWITSKEEIAHFRATSGAFHFSLAQQLREGSLSPRQADFVCKAMFGPRQNKKNRDAWEALHESLTSRE